MNVINNSPIEWTYDLMSNNNASIANGVDASDVLSIQDLDKGTFNLEITYNAYTVVLPIVLDGKDLVIANFEDPIAIEEGSF